MLAAPRHGCAAALRITAAREGFISCFFDEE